MLNIFIIFSCSVPSGCVPGTSYNQKSGVVSIIDSAITPSQIYYDLHMSGSFCPPTSGSYRMIYHGTTDGGNDAAWSSYLWMFSPYIKSRTSEYFFLNSSSCYYYHSAVATWGIQAYGSIYYQKQGGSEILITNSVSYSCCITFDKNPSSTPIFTPLNTPQQSQKNTPIFTPQQSQKNTPIFTPQQSQKNTPLNTPQQTIFHSIPHVDDYSNQIRYIIIFSLSICTLH